MRYRYHWFFKLTALVLAVVSGAVLVTSCAGLILGALGYYERRRESQLYSEAEAYGRHAAEAVFDHFAWKDTGIEPKFFERFFRWGADVDAVDDLEHEFYYQIRSDKSGELLESNILDTFAWQWEQFYEFDVRRGYVTEMPKAEYYPAYGEAGEYETLPPLGEDVTDYEYYVVSDDDSVNWQNVSVGSYRHAEAGGRDYTIYRMEYTHYETYDVYIYMTPEQMEALVDTHIGDEFLPQLLMRYDAELKAAAVWSLVALLLSLLWLALTAGRSPERDDVKPDGLNVIPLDIYLAGAALGGIGLIALLGMALDQSVWNSGWGNYDAAIECFYGDVLLFILCGMGAGGIAALFTMACAAQMKVGDNYWLKHTAAGLCWRYGWRILKQAVLWWWNAARQIVRWIGKLFAGIGQAFRRLGELLPLTWQWLIASGCVWLLMFFCILFAIHRYAPFALLFGIGVTVLLVLYGAYCFGCLRDAARKMSGGSLEEKVEDKLLLGCFGEFAGHLNALGDACVHAAKEQMKSERMKSELITNVSHDIKTPLTSIINYVDLLQKTDDEAERAEYLEVLDRQSQRLKKLIEDLMEMSRASSGNVAVEISPTDVTEAVNQALGEFADNLENCGLSVVLKAPAGPVMARCDGKLLWRVLSNTLSNVVKYAMPGTRVYVDVAAPGSQVEISVKNISAKMLNVSAEELMERFVRGDSSRNTEGNGLGLNIAKSLMELQGGRLDLMVDGDLFKLVLTLNAV